MKKKTLIPALLLGLFLVLPGFRATAQSLTSQTPEILTEIYRLLTTYNFTEAVALFDTIHPAEAASSPIRLLKASVLISAGKSSEARTIVEDVLSREPNNEDALSILDTILAASGYRERQAALEAIIARDPRNVGALVELGKLHFDSRSIANANRYLDQALAIDPANLDALLTKATIYRYQRDPSNAETMLNTAVRNHPNEAAPYHERARLYAGFGFHINALEDLDKAKARAPYDYFISIDRAQTLLELYRKEEALQEFELAIRINPRDYLPYIYTAGIKDELGDYEGAERDYIALAALYPEYVFAYEGIGLHKMRKGEWAAARDAFTEAYRRAPQNDLYYFYALLAAVNWVKAETYAAPRQFLNQLLTRAKRDSLEYDLIRLYYDFTGRVYNGENNMILRLSRTEASEEKARVIFYMALYYDLRGSPTLASRYHEQFYEMNFKSLPEWRLNEWMMIQRGLQFN